jgi:hypothetical protein
MPFLELLANLETNVRYFNERNAQGVFVPNDNTADEVWKPVSSTSYNLSLLLFFNSCVLVGLLKHVMMFYYGVFLNIHLLKVFTDKSYPTVDRLRLGRGDENGP